MQSNDIYINVERRLIELSGAKYIQIGHFTIPVVPLTKEDRTKFFKTALFDYTIDKLAPTAENKVIIEDVGFIAARLASQFNSEEEKENFYSNYVFCILNEYNILTEESLVWEVVPKDEDETITFPRIIDGYFQTKTSTSNEEAMLWLFAQYEKKLANNKAEKNPVNPHKTYQKKRYYH